MSPFENRFNKFLATGEYVATEDARPKKTPKYLSIAEHDARFHPNGYNPDTDTCEFRAKLDAGNKSDEALSNAEFAESYRKMKEMEDKAVKFIHDSGLDVIDRNTRPSRKDMRQKIDVVAYDKDSDEIVFIMLRAHDSPATAKPPTRNQKEALSLAAGAWRKGQKWQGKYRYDIVDMYRNGAMDHTKNVYGPSFIAPEVIHKSAAEDARPKGWKPDPEKFLKNLLSQHDKRFHPDGFNPETDTCTFREQLDKTNNIDDLSAAEKKEQEAKKPFASYWDLLEWEAKKPTTTSKWDLLEWEAKKPRLTYPIDFSGAVGLWPSPGNEMTKSSKGDDTDTAEKKEQEENAISFKVGSKGDPERGRQAIIDGPGAGYLATLEREVAAGKTEGLEKEKERCRHYIENGKDDAEKQLHRDALAFLEELGKKAKADVSPAFKYGKGDFVEEARTGKTWRVGEKGKDTVELWQWPGSGMTRVRIEDFDKDFSPADKSVKAAYEKSQADSEKKEQEENAISFKVGDKVQDPESGGFGKVTDVSGTRIRVSWDNGNATWEFAEQMSKGNPASKAFEPPFDMDKEGLYGYGKTDPSAKDAATLAATFNQRAEWGFSDDEVQAYFDAFKDMDAGKVPKLPDLDGKTYEPPMDTKWNGPQQALAAIFQKRPDLIRPYIIERLEDANFHSEVKELKSGDYKKRTKPYNSEEEYKKRQRRQMAQDAAAVKYLKEC